MKISLTPFAKEKLQETIDDGSYMRIDITRTGCCHYAFTIVPSLKRSGDIIVEVESLTLAVSEGARELLREVRIDYKPKGIRKGFHIQPF